MKKFVLLSIIKLTLLTMVAQENSTTPISFSIKSGVNNSSTNGNDSQGQRSGYLGTEAYGGLFLEKTVSENGSFEIGALISWTDIYTFLETPVVYKYHILKKWHVFSGVRIDFLLNPEEDLNQRGSEVINNIGFGIPIGVQYDISNTFFAETVYNFGFTKLASDNVLDILFARRNTFRVGVGYKF